MAYRRRHPRVMNDAVRVELIINLRKRGWTWGQIGKRVGMSGNGARYAMLRTTQPGRYAEDYEEEVDHTAPREEW
jgi:hypothetical protein